MAEVHRADEDAGAADRGVAGWGGQALALQQPAARRRRAEVLDVGHVAVLDLAREDDRRPPDRGRGLVVGGRGDALERLLGARRDVQSPDVAAARSAAPVDGDDVAVRVGPQRDVPRPLGARQRRLERAAGRIAQREDVAPGRLVERRPRLPAAVAGDRRVAQQLGDRLVGRRRGGGDEDQREREDGRAQTSHGHVLSTRRRDEGRVRCPLTGRARRPSGSRRP